MPFNTTNKRLSQLLAVTLLSSFMGLTPFAFSAEGAEITVYNQNFGLVKDYRTLTLQKGETEVSIDDVAALIDPTSVHFKSLTSPKQVSVLEQNFRYDLINRQNILNRLVGSKIRFVKDGTEQSGILLNPATTYTRYSGYNTSYSTGVRQTNNDVFAVKTANGILVTALDDIIIDKLPEALYPSPQLFLSLNNSKAGAHQTEISYLTDGLNWHTDYVATFSDSGGKSTLDLTGWVTLVNQSGASYKNAKLKLVAGDVQKLSQQPVADAVYAMEARMAKVSQKQFAQEGLFEYHMYTLQRPTDVLNNETKQVTLVSAASIPVSKTYIYDPDKHSPLRWYSNMKPGQGRATSTNNKIATLLKFKNNKASSLGFPLPKGRIRVNMADQSGALQFVGEDTIDHTPEDEEIELFLGNAFDLVGTKKRTRYEQNSNYYQETYEVTLKNHKKEAVNINVIDHISGDWQIKDATLPFHKIDSDTTETIVTVPAKGQKTFQYTVKISRR